jgi:uncharacterized protein (TIGR03435 family)
MLIRFLAAVSLLTFFPIQSFAQSAQSPQASDPNPLAPSAPGPVFAGADVHASPFIPEPWMDGPHLEGDRYVVYQATIAGLIANAYSIDPANVQGGPAWLDFNRFDIVAKGAPTATSTDQKLMLKALLAQRFHLVVHDGTAPMPAYVLKLGKDKPKMKPSDDSGDARCDYQQQPSGQPPQMAFTCHNQTMEQLAQLLRNTRGGGYLDKTVVDETGLKGSFDFDLKWTPSGGRDRAGAASISIFDALDAQLGLKLPLETAPRPVLIVDSVDEIPSPNPPGTETILPPLPLPDFEVAVVTPYKPDTPRRGSIGNGRLDIHGLTLRTLIALAWDLNESNKDVIANEPPWLDKDRWDIVAKMSSDAAADAANKPPQADYRQIQHMLRALLAERFKLQAHIEDRPGSAYNLVAVSPKLTPADPNSRTRCAEGPGPDGKDPRMANPILNRLMHCQNITMAQLGVQFQSIADGYIYNTVLDKTGLKGSFDFTLSFSSVNNMPGNVNGPQPTATSASQSSSTSAESLAPDPNGAVSVFDAVRRELGLKLEQEKRPVPVLVIDHIEETPTPN